MKMKNEKKKPSVFLFKRIALMVCCMLLSIPSIFAQSKTISGTIIDIENEPLIGVSVVVEGTTNGTATDIDGSYSITANPEDVLVFTFIGMEKQAIKVGAQSTINVVLQDNSTMLKETVVIGYGSAKKRDLTGSIVSIKAADIADRPGSNPLASIQGKVAGVQIVNTGRAGQDPEIRIRGTNSLNGYKPLYVVDGLFTDNINYINPADIESMEILKDPSSLAIFGVRGANGVIIITTKRAKDGQTIVNINSSVGLKDVSDRIKMANGDQFRELYSEQLAYLGATFDYTNWQANTNWQDEIFQTAFMTNNNVSITGSSEKSKFYLGVGYASEEGSIKTEKFSKVTVNLNSDYNVQKYLRFGFQVNGSRTSPPDEKNVGAAVLAAPIAPTHGMYTNPQTGQQERLLHTMPGFQRGQVRNPLAEIEYKGGRTKAMNYRIAGNIYGEVDFLEHFKFRTTYSLDFGTNESRTNDPIIWIYNPEITDQKENINDKESISQMKHTDLAAQSDYILTYNNKFGSHGISATAGITTNYKEFSKLEAERSQKYEDIYFPIPNNNSDKWWITSLDKKSMTNDGDQYKRFTMSYLVRGLYNYENKYLFNASYRRDGSSVFRGVGNTWDNFYSFGAGWVVSEEKFMADQDFIDNLKLKASYGVLGSENTADKYYPSYPGLTDSGSAIFGDNILTGYSYEYAVQNLGWEKTYSWEAGFEMNLFNQRLRIEPVYYSKITKDIILEMAGVNGKINSLENFGEIKNSGFELAAAWNDKIGESGVSYSVAANLTTIKNEVLKIDKADTGSKMSGVSRTMKGLPLAHFYGYKVVGVYQNNEDIYQSPMNTIETVLPGDLKFADIDGDGKITPNDRTDIGNPTPDFTYGLNLGLSYKGFDLGIDMMGVYGNEVYRDWGLSDNAQLNYRSSRMGRWNGEGTSNWEPILDSRRSINRKTSSYFVEDGSFFRIRNIQLGYTFSPSLLQNIKLTSLRVYGNVQNLKTWSKTSSFSPEVGGDALSFGVDKGTYPMPVVYTFGVNLTF